MEIKDDVNVIYLYNMMKKQSNMFLFICIIICVFNSPASLCDFQNIISM